MKKGRAVQSSVVVSKEGGKRIALFGFVMARQSTMEK
jgi:hypothetical protein